MAFGKAERPRKKQRGVLGIRAAGRVEVVCNKISKGLRNLERVAAPVKDGADAPRGGVVRLDPVHCGDFVYRLLRDGVQRPVVIAGEREACPCGAPEIGLLLLLGGRDRQPRDRECGHCEYQAEEKCRSLPFPGDAEHRPSNRVHRKTSFSPFGKAPEPERGGRSAGTTPRSRRQG